MTKKSSSDNKSLVLDTSQCQDQPAVYLADFSVPPQHMETINFDIYEKDNASQMLMAQDAHLEYIGQTANTNCKYLLGRVQDNTVIVQNAHFVTVHTRVKKIQESFSDRLIGPKNALARNQLGQTFGTKKRKTIIRNREINEIKVEGIEEIADIIQEKLHDTIAAMPDTGNVFINIQKN